MRFIRYAGFSERRCIARDIFGLYGAIVTLATYSEQSSLSTEDCKKAFIQALRHCVKEHAVLRMVVRDAESEHPRVEEIPLVHLDKHLYMMPTETRHGNCVSRRLLEHIHNDTFDQPQEFPQWRLYIVPMAFLPERRATEYKVAFAASHALTDGMSGFIFHSSFLAALQICSRPASNTALIYETKSTDSTLPLALDQAVPLPISTSCFLRVAASEFLPQSLLDYFAPGWKEKTNIWLGAPRRPERRGNRQLLQTAVRANFVSHTIVKKVLRNCRRHDTRLTALINRLTAYALAASLASRSLHYSAFSVQTSIDLRRCIPGSMNKMVNYFSVVGELIKPNSTCGATFAFDQDDWEAVRQSTARLSEKSSSLADQSIALLKYVGNIQEWTSKTGKTGPTDSFTTANLGTFECRSVDNGICGSHWSVEDMAFSQTGNRAGEPLSINVASVQDGPLSFTLCWEPHTLGIDDEEAFIEEISGFILNGFELLGNQ